MVTALGVDHGVGRVNPSSDWMSDSRGPGVGGWGLLVPSRGEIRRDIGRCLYTNEDTMIIARDRMSHLEAHGWESDHEHE